MEHGQRGQRKEGKYFFQARQCRCLCFTSCNSILICLSYPIISCTLQCKIWMSPLSSNQFSSLMGKKNMGIDTVGQRIYFRLFFTLNILWVADLVTLISRLRSFFLIWPSQYQLMPSTDIYGFLFLLKREFKAATTRT